MRKLEYHPLANLFPLMEGEEYRALVEDIRANGLRDPIYLWEGKILDGRNRYRACQEAGKPFFPRDWDGPGDPLDFVVSKNLRRRHLDENQRALVAGKISNLKRGRHANGPIGPFEGQAPSSVPGSVPGSVPVSVPEAAKMMNVGERSVKRARAVLANGVHDLQSAVESGAVSMTTAAAVARKPPEEQREIVSQGPAAITQAAREVRVGRRASAQVSGGDQDDGKRQLTSADADTIYERVASGESAASVAKDYGVATKIVGGIVGSRSSGAASINVPDGSTVESQVRAGMALEADGRSTDEASRQVGIGAVTYRRVRELIVLLDEVELRPADRDTVVSAIGDINRTRHLGAHETTQMIVDRVWGQNSPYHTAKTAKRRLDHFDTVVGNAINAAQLLDGLEFPYLTPGTAKKLAKEVRAAVGHLTGFAKRLDKESN